MKCDQILDMANLTFSAMIGCQIAESSRESCDAVPFVPVNPFHLSGVPKSVY